MTIKGAITQKIERAAAYSISSINQQLRIELTHNLRWSLSNSCVVKMQLVWTEHRSREFHSV